VTTETDGYVTDDAHGDMWRLMLGDSCERMAEIPDESVDLSVSSPPFASLFVYSPSARDLGNSSTRTEFLDHYRFIIREQLRVTKPGRNACVHVQQLTTSKATHGHIGLTDFRGDVIRAFQDEGWIFYGEVTIWKCPQAQSIRTHAYGLAFQTKNRDSMGIRPALADYLLIFKKPGDNAVKIPHDAKDGDFTNDEWIEWASPIWFDRGEGAALGGEHISPVWTDIKETNTLNVRAGRDPEDERHICPLQLDFIDRCVRMYSRPGETVLTPFAGIGSELYVSVKRGRRALGIELKPSYWATAVKTLRGLDDEMSQPRLFEL
jgi:DNA modification methylase